MQLQDSDLHFSRQSFLSSISQSLPSPLRHEDLDLSRHNVFSIIDKIIENLPQNALDPRRAVELLHRTCELQEQKVYTRLCLFRNMDIYDEMKKVSAELSDLRQMGMEELNLKLGETVERLKRIEAKGVSSAFSEESSSFAVKIEEEEDDETTLHSKYTCPNIMRSTESSICEKNENEDPMESQEKKDIFSKMDDICLTSLALPRKNKKMLDFNNIHNFLDENEGAYHSLHNEMNILKEIDLNEGLSHSRLYEWRAKAFWQSYFSL